MKTKRNRKMAHGGWVTRSALECGSPLPLSHGPIPTRGGQSASGLAQSKTWRTALLPVFCFIILHSAFILRAWGQYSIDWSTIDGGGGTSTGGVYTVSGTIGQPDASTTPMTGGNYSLTGGFWALYAVQTPGAPLLMIVGSSPGFATISWTPATGTNWGLQETLSLSLPAWTNSPSGTNNPATVPATLPTKFYRLFKP